MDADTIEYRPSESPDFESDDYLEHLAISLLPDINSEDYQNENADEDEDDYDYYGDQQYQHDQVMDADDGSSSVMEMQDGKMFPSIYIGNEADSMIKFSKAHQTPYRKIYYGNALRVLQEVQASLAVTTGTILKKMT